MIFRILYLSFIFLFLNVSGFSQEPGHKHKAEKPPACDPLLWNHVWNPKRLKIRELCVTVSGTIEEKKEEEDGDLHMLLRLDGPYKKMLNSINNKFRNGCMVVEAICESQVKDEHAIEPCRGYSSNVHIPRKGDHVWVTGAYVLDKHNGWNEIHPVTEIREY